MNLTEIQNKIISEKIKLRKKSKNVVNNFKKIEKYIQKEVAIITESKDSIIPEIEFKDIDDYNLNGDYIESQAFAYLAIRSYLDLPISFPDTTSCKFPISGGVINKNF